MRCANPGVAVAPYGAVALQPATPCAVAPPLHQPNRPRIPRDRLVRGQQERALGFRLGDKYSIEGILMDCREIPHRHGMRTSDRELVVVVFQQPAPQDFGINPEIRTAEPRLIVISQRLAALNNSRLR